MTTIIDHVHGSTPPWILRSSAEPSGLVASFNNVKIPGNLAVRLLDGSLMANINELFAVFAEAFDFPDYFGNNSSAFSECMTDLSWLPASGYVAVISNSEELLKREPSEVSWLIESLRRISEAWSVPITVGESWDRPARPFHFILMHKPQDIGQLQLELLRLPLIPELSR